MPKLDHGIPKRFEKRHEADRKDKKDAKKWQQIQDRLAKMTKMRESIENNEKEEDYIDGDTLSSTYLQGTNQHRFTFPTSDYLVKPYAPDTDLWHCYVVEFDNAALVGAELSNYQLLLS